MNEAGRQSLWHRRGVRTGAGCWYDADYERLDPGEPERVVAIERAYIEAHTATVREQLARAGVRLAGLLERALGH